MGGKTRLQTQRLLVKSDFVAVLGRIFENLTWATTAEDSGPEPGDPVSPNARFRPRRFVWTRSEAERLLCTGGAVRA